MIQKIARKGLDVKKNNEKILHQTEQEIECFITSNNATVSIFVKTLRNFGQFKVHDFDSIFENIKLQIFYDLRKNHLQMQYFFWTFNVIPNEVHFSPKIEN